MTKIKQYHKQIKETAKPKDYEEVSTEDDGVGYKQASQSSWRSWEDSKEASQKERVDGMIRRKCD